MARFAEFFEVQKVFAMRNLTIFITICVGSVVVVFMAVMDTLTGEIYAAYMLAGGGVYSFGKWQDDKTRRSAIEADAEPAIVPQSVTTINQPDAVNVQGEVKTTRKRK